MSSPKEIAEKIIKGKEYITSIDTEPRKLARAYLDAAKELETTKAALSELEVQELGSREAIERMLQEKQVLVNYSHMQNKEITKLKEELNLGKSSLRCGQCGNIGMFHNGVVMADEITKLKKSREGLRKQLSIFSKLEISTNVSYDTNIGKKAREALEADDNLMKEV